MWLIHLSFQKLKDIFVSYILRQQHPGNRFRKGKIWTRSGHEFLLYNFIKKCKNNSQNECIYTAIFRQLVTVFVHLVICILGNQFKSVLNKIQIL